MSSSYAFERTVEEVAVAQGLSPYTPISDVLAYLMTLGLSEGLARIMRELDQMHDAVDRRGERVSAAAAEAYCMAARTLAVGPGPGYVRPRAAA